MRNTITASLALVLVAFTSVGWAQQRMGSRGRGNQQFRGNQSSGYVPSQFRRSGSQYSNGNCCGRSMQTLSGFSTSSLSSLEAQSLLDMREEEKLARDVYLALGEQWNLPIFATIAKAESRHMAAVGNLLVKYNLSAPVANDVRGRFTNPKFTKLYQELLATGSQSATAALQVGVQIEQLDIADLEIALSKTRQADIRKVFQNLLKGSQQHLRAFTAQL